MNIAYFVKRSLWGLSWGVIALVLCDGCRLGPRYYPPCVEMPEDWKAPLPPPVATPCVAFWWEVFDDEILNEFEQIAIENNPNLYVAAQRVLEARALTKVRKADLFPQINLTPSYSNSGQLIQFFAPPSNNPQINQAEQTPFRILLREYILPLNLSYELDLWGKLRGQYESAFLNTESKIDAFRTTLLSLTTDLASAYFLLRSLDSQIELYQATIDELTKSYELTLSRFNKGLVTYLDVTTASLQKTNVESNLFDVQRQRALQEDKIALLLGRPPSLLCIEPLPLSGPPPIVPAGIPSTVLLQRPDIAEAERTRASEHALIGVAYASLFPSLTLTGSIGYLSPDLRQFLHWISRYWAMGANVGQTVFDGGRDFGNIEAAYARFRQADGTYQQKVLTAFQEVEDALNSLDLESKQADSLSQSVEAAKIAAELSMKRYKTGLTSYLQVVDSQRSLLDAQRNLATLQGVRYLSTIQLIKAFGGGWECDDEATGYCE